MLLECLGRDLGCFGVTQRYFEVFYCVFVSFWGLFGLFKDVFGVGLGCSRTSLSSLGVSGQFGGIFGVDFGGFWAVQPQGLRGETFWGIWGLLGHFELLFLPILGFF